MGSRSCARDSDPSPDESLAQPYDVIYLGNGTSGSRLDGSPTARTGGRDSSCR